MLITRLTETEGSDSSSRTRPSVTEESSKSSRTLKPSSISSGSSSVCLIYGPQLKLSSFERPLIFFPPPVLIRMKRTWCVQMVVEPSDSVPPNLEKSKSHFSLSRSFPVNDGRLNTVLWGTPE